MHPLPVSQQSPGVAVVVQAPLASQTLPGGPRVPRVVLLLKVNWQSPAFVTQAQPGTIWQHATVVVVVDEVVVVVVLGAFWHVWLPGPVRGQKPEQHSELEEHGIPFAPQASVVLVVVGVGVEVVVLPAGLVVVVVLAGFV